MRILHAGFLPRLSKGFRAAALAAALTVTTGGEECGRPVELFAGDRAVLESLGDAPLQFRTWPASGHVRATSMRKGPTLDEERELDVYWKGNLLKRVVLSRSRPASRGGGALQCLCSHSVPPCRVIDRK